MSAGEWGKLLAVVGPTAAGKTTLALALAEARGAEIICCDALQLRAGLPLLTAKPTAEELGRVPHHLIGVLPLSRPATAAQYVALAEQHIAEVRGRGKVVVLCGGTGLYLRALCLGLFAGPQADPAFRAALREEAARVGVASLHVRLRAVDPAAAARIAQADYVRIERALEVFTLTGRPISQLQAEGRERGPRHQVVRIGLDPGPAMLRQRIAARIEWMLGAGLLAEVARVDAELGLFDSPPLGYVTVRRHLHGELTLQQMREELLRETARYAKRQRTWFRREPGVTWYRSAAEVPLRSADACAENDAEDND